MSTQAESVRRAKHVSFDWIVFAAWIVTAAAVSVRIGLASSQNDLVATYADAGAGWLRGLPLYSTTSGFIYSPLVAGLFAPLSLVPHSVGAILWRLLNVGVFAGAIFWWLKSEIHDRVKKRHFSVVFLLLLPLAIGNLNNGQVNPLIIGLLIFSILAAHYGHWTLCAICIGIATYFKIYPLCVGLLLILFYPRQLAWRLIVVLVLLGALSFVLQRPSYVLEQYQRWISSRAADNRRTNMHIAPRDFAMFLQVFHIYLSARALLLLQVLAGGLVAIVCWLGRDWPENRRLVCLLTLASCWMLLFGPSTESATYVVLAPAVVLALVQAFQQEVPPWMRFLLLASFSVLLSGLFANSFLDLKKGVYSKSVQPFGALLFTIFAVPWLTTTRFWRGDRTSPTTAG
jgi:glycosyl transferase family 87